MRYTIYLLLFITLLSCKQNTEEYILISKDSNNMIEQWLHSANSELLIRGFYSIDKNSMQFLLSRASGRDSI